MVSEIYFLIDALYLGLGVWNKGQGITLARLAYARHTSAEKGSTLRQLAPLPAKSPASRSTLQMLRNVLTTCIRPAVLVLGGTEGGRKGRKGGRGGREGGRREGGREGGRGEDWEGGREREKL